MASVGGEDHPDQQVLSKREAGKCISVGNANGAELGTTSKWSWKDGEFMANTSGRARNITKVQLQLHLSWAQCCEIKWHLQAHQYWWRNVRRSLPVWNTEIHHAKTQSHACVRRAVASSQRRNCICFVLPYLPGAEEQSSAGIWASISTASVDWAPRGAAKVEKAGKSFSENLAANFSLRKNVLALGFTTSLCPQKLLHAAQSSATGADSIRQPAVSSQCALSCTKWGQHTDSTIPMYTGDYGDGFIKTIDLRRATVETGEYKSVRRWWRHPYLPKTFGAQWKHIEVGLDNLIWSLSI